MFGPGMTEERYKKLSRKWKIAYWCAIAVGFGLIAYIWIFKLRIL